MLLLAAIVLIVGIGDILRDVLRGRVGTLAAGGMLVGVTAVVLLGVWLLAEPHWWLLALCLPPVVLWYAAVPAGAEAPPRSVRAVAPAIVGFIVLCLVVTLWGDSILEGPEALSLPQIGRFNTEFAVLAAGVVLFHVSSANSLVRLALGAEHGGRGSGDRALVVRPPQLKGGRWIGPLERIALTALLVAGAYPVAAGLLAAKGIVRFPEMQEDRAEGNRAEYFLVGSFVSWTLAIVAAGLLWSVL